MDAAHPPGYTPASGRGVTMDGGRVEGALERTLFAARWLLAPIYLGLVAVLGLLVVVFARELWHHVAQALTLSGEGAILAALTLIDLALVANLVLIVMFSGYESTVGAMDVGDARPAWMGRVDFGGLKVKLAASIVAISGIQLLKQFMAIGGAPIDDAGARKLLWLAVLHGLFVAAAVLLAVMDRLGGRKG